MARWPAPLCTQSSTIHQRRSRTLRSRRRRIGPVDGRRGVRHQEREQVGRVSTSRGTSTTASACELDYHDSTADLGRGQPVRFECGARRRELQPRHDHGAISARISRSSSVVAPRRRHGIDPQMMQVTGSSFRNSYTKSGGGAGAAEGQLQLHRAIAARLRRGPHRGEQPLGVLRTCSPTTPGAASPASRRRFIRTMSGSPNTVRQFLRSDLRQRQPEPVEPVLLLRLPRTAGLARAARRTTRRSATCPLNGNNAVQVACYEASNVWGTDRRTKEESKSAYRAVQPELGPRGADPHGAGPALRADRRHLERARADRRPASTGPATTSSRCSSRAPDFTTLEGEYDYLLPSIDFAFDLRDNLKLRASVGKSIGRPDWGDIQGGQTLNRLARIDGGTGAQGNPSLKPLESRNYRPVARVVLRRGQLRCRWATSARTSTTTSASTDDRSAAVRTAASGSSARAITTKPSADWRRRQRPHLYP